MDLSYLDKVFATSQQCGAAAQRYFRWQLLLSLFLLALTTGLVTSDESIEVSGIKLTIPLWTVMVISAIAVGGAGVLSAIYGSHGHLLTKVALDRYTELGAAHPASDRKRGIFLDASPVEVILNTTARSVAAQHEVVQALSQLLVAVAYVGLAFLLAVGAQLATLIKLSSDFGWHWYIWLPLGALAVLTTLLLAWAGRQSTDPDKAFAKRMSVNLWE